MRSAPSIGSDGTVYLAGWQSGVIFAINPDGTKKWESTVRAMGASRSSPAIGSDGTLYVGSKDYKLYALNPDGTKRWECELGGRVYTSPAIGSDGTVYIGSYDDKKLHAINPDGTKKWEFKTGDGIEWSSPAIGSDGTLYFGSKDRKVYALETSSTGPANSPWPMFGQNAQRTARAPLHDVDSFKIKLPDSTIWPFIFSFTSAEDITYEIQVTHDLKNWSKLGEVKGTGDEVKFIDPRQPIVPFERNYYRVKLVE